MGQPHKKQKGHIRGEDLMTEEQFKEAKEKVKKYSDIQSCIDRLKLDNVMGHVNMASTMRCRAMFA